MSEANKDDDKLSLKVMINKERSKVLFAEADMEFVQILLSFSTLPLGRIVKVLEKHYGDEAPKGGSFTGLYRSIVNLDTAHFVKEGAKITLLSPTSSIEYAYQWLKLDITDYHPAKYMECPDCHHDLECCFEIKSIYYDEVKYCPECKHGMKKNVKSKVDNAAFIVSFNKASFIVCDDLHILPNETAGILEIIGFLGTTNIDEAEAIEMDVGFNEIMSLLKASLTSPTPLSDVILSKTTRMRYSAVVASQPQIANEECHRNFILKVVTQKSTGKLLFVEAKNDFVEFLFSFLHIPVGGVEHLLGGTTCIKAFDALYCSTADLKDEHFLDVRYAKERLLRPNLRHGCISENHILPLTEECLPYEMEHVKFSSVKFPKGKGIYLRGPPTCQVKDDLTVAPFCAVSILSSLTELRISISDVKEEEMQVGLKEGLSILKASLTSTSALTDGLLITNRAKRPKREA